MQELLRSLLTEKALRELKPSSLRETLAVGLTRICADVGVCRFDVYVCFGLLLLPLQDRPARASFVDAVVTLWVSLSLSECISVLSSLSEALKRSPASTELRELLFRLVEADHPLLRMLSNDRTHAAG